MHSLITDQTLEFLSFKIFVLLGNESNEPVLGFGSLIFLPELIAKLLILLLNQFHPSVSLFLLIYVFFFADWYNILIAWLFID